MSAIPGYIRRDLSGQRFGRLLVLSSDVFISKSKPRRWMCKCDCGKEISIRGTSLTTGSTISCGCYNLENNKSKQNLEKIKPKSKLIDTGKLTFKEFCTQYGLSEKIVRTRLKKGWGVKRTLTTPVDSDIVKRNKRSRAKGKKVHCRGG